MRTVKALNDGSKYDTLITNGFHQWVADEPTDLEGMDSGPSPGELLCSALGSCVAITLRMYVDRKGWDVGDIKVHVVYDEDPKDSNNTIFKKEIYLSGEVDEKQKKRILQIAGKCPIEKILTGSIAIGSEVVE